MKVFNKIYIKFNIVSIKDMFKIKEDTLFITSEYVID